ncbi:MAG TPA: hypothetical protein VI997_11605 [Candidatus Thermoplasmatota archaeon]|nr:hypothetical protein [Candidatus Thermoplasmatota archaeon]
MARLGLLARLAGAFTSFELGRAVGRHLDRNGWDLSDDLRRDLESVWGKEGRWAFAAGVATFGWALVRQRETLFVFLAGLLLGWGAWEKLLQMVRENRVLPASGNGVGPVVDTTATGA